MNLFAHHFAGHNAYSSSLYLLAGLLAVVGIIAFVDWRAK